MTTFNINYFKIYNEPVQEIPFTHSFYEPIIKIAGRTFLSIEIQNVFIDNEKISWNLEEWLNYVN
jgi:CRISPR/Cas system endoribonuclease Cas6 (RAMP superfamily)